MRTLGICLVAVLNCATLLADEPAKPDAPAKKAPSSIFDFGLDPIPNTEDGEKGKTEKPKTEKPIDKPKVEKPVEIVPPPVKENVVTPPKAVVKPPVVVNKPPVVNVNPPKAAPIDVPKGGATGELAEMLKACHVSPDGIITVDQIVTFDLHGTDGKDFVITGELYPTKEPILFNTGGVIFHLRERDGKHRYELSIGGMRVKRVLLEGNVVPKFAGPMKFEGITREEWHPFKVEVSTAAITAQFADQKGVAKGPLEVGGGNHMMLAPGAKLRNLKVEIRKGA